MCIEWVSVPSRTWEAFSMNGGVEAVTSEDDLHSVLLFSLVSDGLTDLCIEEPRTPAENRRTQCK